LYNSLTGSLFDRQVKYEMLSYLPDLLIRQDKMSMAHSIENRVPFLDNEVVENSFTIPEKYLLLRKSPEGYNSEKYLLKKMTADTFGNDFAFRDKMGFGIPVREYFLDSNFKEYLKDKILPGIKGRGLFNYELASEWFSDIRNLKYNEIEALWVIVSFEIWASVYLDTSHENRHTRN
jgi:asparagine synthase (glutamine-hydrolysing)